MRICRVIALFIVFENFGTVLIVLELFFLFWKLNFQAVIKSAASAADLIMAGKFSFFFKCASLLPNPFLNPAV